MKIIEKLKIIIGRANVSFYITDTPDAGPAFLQG
jgi:hypothetical protein